VPRCFVTFNDPATPAATWSRPSAPSPNTAFHRSSPPTSSPSDLRREEDRVHQWRANTPESSLRWTSTHYCPVGRQLLAVRALALAGKLAVNGQMRPERLRDGAARVAVTSEAADVLRRLHREHGPLMFHQSGGCCDGSAPMCYRAGEFHTGRADVFLGALAVDGLADGIPVWMSAAQFEYWKHTHLTTSSPDGAAASRSKPRTESGSYSGRAC
jgi:uncharacterized protein